MLLVCFPLQIVALYNDHSGPFFQTSPKVLFIGFNGITYRSSLVFPEDKPKCELRIWDKSASRLVGHLCRHTFFKQKTDEMRLDLNLLMTPVTLDGLRNGHSPMSHTNTKQHNLTWLMTSRGLRPYLHDFPADLAVDRWFMLAFRGRSAGSWEHCLARSLPSLRRSPDQSAVSWLQHLTQLSHLCLMSASVHTGIFPMQSRHFEWATSDFSNISYHRIIYIISYIGLYRCFQSGMARDNSSS